ncbi:TIP41-domain-containing protein [Wallemia mellicola]|uniref:TIP41-domain-containing protein n=1 Tax=Wallemia mellicola TaxID=1708541 RepID=A0A4T0QIY4_9BASI|nr:TIP41-domain-containing protein [Wallemia mellicola]TIC24131.1 TIP41-domain-containing protein [Wallemia mellicola]
MSKNHKSEYKLNNWVINTQKSTIPSMKETEEFCLYSLSEELGIPPPEMTFLDSFVELRDNDSDFKISFNTRDALRGVSKKNELRVSYADHWANSTSNRQTEESSTIKPSQPWDWTYTTRYNGSTSNVFSTSNNVNDTIPIDKLSDTNQPILFYDDVQLYEDELGDNGQVGLNVKIRVMPFGWFILQRLFLRVDKVLFRMFDVRVYHEFNSGVVIRESTGLESSWDAVKQCLPPTDATILSDEPTIQATLKMISRYANEQCTKWDGLGSLLDVCKL